VGAETSTSAQPQLARAVWESFYPRPEEHLSEPEPYTYTVSVGASEETFDIDGTRETQDFVAAFPDRIQTVLMEERQEMTPACPRHPGAHPMVATVMSEAVWVCPADETPVRAILDPN
jgi:hypothetical protein